MKLILLIMIGLSMLHAEFTKSGNIVTDSVSGLQWQDDAAGSVSTWENAIKRCESLSLGSNTDWRLPKINELKSIVDRSSYDSAIVEGFENTTSYYYWSSSKYEKVNNCASTVNFYNGIIEANTKSNDYHVRCVRAGK